MMDLRELLGRLQGVEAKGNWAIHGPMSLP